VLSHKEYEDVKHLIAPGDIIAFGGTSLFSRWTKLTTSSVVTHTALVIDSPDTPTDQHLNDLTMIEATSIKGKKGVMHNYVGERIRTYKGDIWWLPLHNDAKTSLEQNWLQFHDFLADQLNKSYDIWQLFGAAIDTFDDHKWFRWLTYNRRKFNRWFCSELVAEGLRHGGILSELNASETTPKDVCQFNIYDRRYVQLKGKPKPIPQFNTLDPEGWGFVDGLEKSRLSNE
jgi:hypothetical protein